jgi:hypothetical protein
MSANPRPSPLAIVHATREEPLSRSGDAVRIRQRSPVGHYRVSTYLRCKNGNNGTLYARHWQETLRQHFPYSSKPAVSNAQQPRSSTLAYMSEGARL